VLLLLTIGKDFTWVTLVVLKDEYPKHLLSEKYLLLREGTALT